ncbi:hypothetical protein BGX28_005882 [Mortierella sp. GBA30]|nr:hypothetical protein BGX28_005882 [Mortierella sp. GBA30]
MVVSFRNIFISENQRQVKAEAHNIGLAHAIRDLITGSNHEAPVDNYRKKKAVKALQKAHPDQVNELITILKAMPDPTVVKFKQVHNREASNRQRQPEMTSPTSTVSDTNTPTKYEGINTENSNEPLGSSEANSTPEPIKAPSSWWAVSFASLLASIGNTSPENKPSVTTTTTTITTITMTSQEVAKAAEAEAAEIAEAEGAVVKVVISEASASAVPPVSSMGEEGGKGTVSKMTTSTTVAECAVADKTVLVSTLNSIKQQMVALLKAPPTDVISASSYWWGFEIYVPHSCMAKLSRATNTSQIFLGFLAGAVSGVPGLAALVPLSKIVAAYVGLQWALINAQDLGKGVILAATW